MVKRSEALIIWSVFCSLLSQISYDAIKRLINKLKKTGHGDCSTWYRCWIYLDMQMFIMNNDCDFWGKHTVAPNLCKEYLNLLTFKTAVLSVDEELNMLIYFLYHHVQELWSFKNVRFLWPTVHIIWEALGRLIMMSLFAQFVSENILSWHCRICRSFVVGLGRQRLVA